MATGVAGQTYVLPSAVADPTKPRIIGKGEDGTNKEMFLQLMLAQLKNQDPTAPMDQKDMMASITQFSQVEQMQNMATAMETLSLTQGVGLIGKDVEYTSVIKNDEGQVMREVTAQGRVKSVQQTAGGVRLLLEGAAGEVIRPSDIKTVF